MGTHIEAGTSARDSERKSSSVPHVGVVALGEELDDADDLHRVAVEEESEGRDGGATDVVIDIRDGDVEELPNGLVVGRASVRHGDRVDTSVSKDGVLGYIASVPCRRAERLEAHGITQQRLDESICVLSLAVHEE
jgi:hypothetical protein